MACAEVGLLSGTGKAVGMLSLSIILCLRCCGFLPAYQSLNFYSIII